MENWPLCRSAVAVSAPEDIPGAAVRVGWGDSGSLRIGPGLRCLCPSPYGQPDSSCLTRVSPDNAALRLAFLFALEVLLCALAAPGHSRLNRPLFQLG